MKQISSFGVKLIGLMISSCGTPRSMVKVTLLWTALSGAKFRQKKCNNKFIVWVSELVDGFRLPLPLTARACRCYRALDPLGDHRTACPRSETLRSRGTHLERAAPRVRREAGARVSTRTLLSELNIPTVHRIENRRIEVIANGLPLWGGIC